jgi:hypothetical protein
MPNFKVSYKEDKAIPVTEGRVGPEDCETSRISHSVDNRPTNGSEDVSLTSRRILSTGRLIVLISVRG